MKVRVNCQPVMMSEKKRNEIKLKRNKKVRSDAKKMNKLKRKRSDEDLDMAKELRRKTMASPQAKLVGS